MRTVIWCLIPVLLFGCERRELSYPLPSTEADVEITADWSGAGLGEEEQHHGATALFYPASGGSPEVVLMGDRTRKVVRLAEGRYSVILFNRSFHDFGRTAFRGESTYSTLEAYAKRIEPLGTDGAETPPAGRVVTEGPDELAVARMETFEVTGNAAAAARGEENSNSLHLLPEKLTGRLTVRILIRGLNNIRSASCTLGGVAGSVFLASGMCPEETVTQKFELSDAVFLPGSPDEGTLSATFPVFGFDGELPHELSLEALLVDGKTEYTADFKDMEITRTEEADGSISFTIELTGTEPVPDVKPEGGSGSGFDVDVGGWGDDVNTDIPVK